jgi:hypothetical protein
MILDVICTKHMVATMTIDTAADEINSSIMQSTGTGSEATTARAYSDGAEIKLPYPQAVKSGRVAAIDNLMALSGMLCPDLSTGSPFLSAVKARVNESLDHRRTTPTPNRRG